MDDSIRLRVLASLGALVTRLASSDMEPPAVTAALRAIVGLMGGKALVKPVAPCAAPADGLADEVRAAGFRLSDYQVEEMVRDGTDPTKGLSGSAEVRRLLASFNLRRLPEWAEKMEDGREAFLRKLVREHALDPVRPAPRTVPEPEQLPLEKPATLQEFLAEHPELTGKARPLLEGMGELVKSAPRVVVEPPPLEGAELEAAKRRAKGLR